MAEKWVGHGPTVPPAPTPMLTSNLKSWTFIFILFYYCVCMCDLPARAADGRSPRRAAQVSQPTSGWGPRAEECLRAVCLLSAGPESRRRRLTCGAGLHGSIGPWTRVGPGARGGGGRGGTGPGWVSGVWSGELVACGAGCDN